MSIQKYPPQPLSKVPVKLHLGYLDGLRALAAVYVVLNHACSMHAHGEDLTGHARLLYLIFLHGHSAVNLFIVLSGFCLMLPVVRGDGQLRGGALNFFKKRARRILPPYFFALGFSLLLIWLFIGQPTGTEWDLSIPVTWKGILAHLFLVQDAFLSTRSSIDAPLWSVSVEWRIYFIFPLLVLSWKRLGPFITTAICVGLSLFLLVALAYTPINTGTPGVSPQYLALFALGALACGITFSQEAGLTTLRNHIPWMLISFILFLAVVVVTKSGAVPTAYADYIVGCWAMTVLIAAGKSSQSWLHQALSWKPLVFLGTFAYSIYLIHAPLLQVIWQYGLHPLHLSPLVTLLALFTVGLAAILAVAYGFFLVCERPFLNTRPHETMKQTAEDAALSPAP